MGFFAILKYICKRYETAYSYIQVVQFNGQFHVPPVTFVPPVTVVFIDLGLRVGTWASPYLRRSAEGPVTGQKLSPFRG